MERSGVVVETSYWPGVGLVVVVVQSPGVVLLNFDWPRYGALWCLSGVAVVLMLNIVKMPVTKSIKLGTSDSGN